MHLQRHGVMNESQHRAFNFLEHIAADMSAGDLSFPTFIDATVKVRLALNNPDLSADRLASIVASEPLLSAKVVRLANSVALGAAGKAVTDVKTAVMRVGFANVRAVAVAVAMEQLLASKDLQAYVDRAGDIWAHSINVAAIAYVLARKMTRLSPDEALFAGLVHDIGYFYLLSRAAHYPELAEHPDDLDAVLMQWHAGVGQAVLHSLGLPEEVLRAVGDHEVNTGRVPPVDLTDVVVLANLATRCPNPLAPPRDPTGQGCRLDEAALTELLTKSADELKAMVASLKA